MGRDDGSTGTRTGSDRPTRILVVTDAWYPQINGVVRTLDALKSRLKAAGHEVLYITPDEFRSVPCPSYSEIRLAITRPAHVGKIIDAFHPCAIHIATEGPLGLMARTHCKRHRYPFTTAFHTRFPHYIHARWKVPMSWTYGLLRWFHGPSSGIMVATQSIENDLLANGFKNVRRWSRGVDTGLFRPRSKDFLSFARPISIYVGRIAVEKSIEDFLRLDLEGTKVVVGDGPQLPDLKERYPDVCFVGQKVGDELASYYAAADVFVFPSRTDTFGLVLLEALASGVPVAAYPVPGPIDVIDGSGAGCLDSDLGAAVRGALRMSPDRCRAHAERFSWDTSVDQFLSNIHIYR